MRLAPVILVSLLALSLAQLASAEDKRQWIGTAGPDGGSLVYGTPASDDMVFGLYCHAPTGEAVIVFTYEPIGATDGMSINMELSSEGGTKVLEAEGHRLLLDDSFILEARAKSDPALFRIITEGSILSVMVEDGVSEISLAGAADAAGAVVGACR
jgi:hypothetical protein